MPTLTDETRDARHGRRPRKPLLGLADIMSDESELFEVAFSSVGFRVEILSHRSDAAFAAVRTHHPAIVVSRITPDRFGIDLVTSIRADDSTRGIPVILLTSYAIPQWQADARAAGADAVLLLPVFIDDLCALAWQLAHR